MLDARILARTRDEKEGPRYTSTVTGKLKVVVSDFHIGEGQEPGSLNPWENFHHDDKFAELLRYYSTDYYEDEDVELIVNGDFYDLLQVRHDGEFPDVITEEIASAKVKACLDGHPIVTRALAAFIEQPKKRITFIPGNHDIEFVFPRCRRLFREAVTGSPLDERVHFIIDRDFYDFDGVQVHHGHQFEAMNTFDMKRIFLSKGLPAPVLNLPWGSVFILKVLNRLKEKRPYIDRIQPFNLYLYGAIFLDPVFAFQLMALSFFHFVRTRVLTPFSRKRRAHVLKTLKIILEYSAYPDLDARAKKVFEENPGCHALLVGHTHLACFRRFGRDRIYINTGTWTDLISLDVTALGRRSELTYALVEYPEEGSRPRASLKAWSGYHELWRDIHSL
jgi:UDP-2,3-diacylglucosamine pyrophosphatase LpxH